MKENIKSIEEYIRVRNMKKETEEKEYEKLVLAKKNGFDNYDDYSYSIFKEYSVNPKMPLNKKYYSSCQKYLLRTLKLFLNYKKSGKSYDIDKNGNRYDLTLYSLNELINAVYRNDNIIINSLDENNLSINDFIKLVYTTELVKEDENKLGIKRG